MTREDANWCFVPVDITRATFKEQYWPESLDGRVRGCQVGSIIRTGATDDKVRVAEYWVKKPKTLTLALTQAGETIDCTEDDEIDGSYTAEQKLRAVQANGARIEKRDSYVICRYLITATMCLRRNGWAGLFPSCRLSARKSGSAASWFAGASFGRPRTPSGSTIISCRRIPRLWRCSPRRRSC
jgi:hypothetical protein